MRSVTPRRVSQRPRPREGSERHVLERGVVFLLYVQVVSTAQGPRHAYGHLIT